jgi:clan AA aspartic protease
VSTFREEIDIADVDGLRYETVEALVDTGAAYTTIPRDILGQIGLIPDRERRFVLANGQKVTYGAAWARVRIRGVEQPTLVIFGDLGSLPLLGAVTLEEFSLGVDPLNRRLIEVESYLASLSLQS